MTDSELLHYYGENTRIIHGGQRSPSHLRLLELGYIEEHPLSLRNVLITVTNAEASYPRLQPRGCGLGVYGGEPRASCLRIACRRCGIR
jgi:hypothetical protein